MTNTIKVKTDQMQKLVDLHRLNESGAAKKIGVGRQTYRRAMGGENVSAGFVAGACLGFQVPFDALFNVVSLEQATAA